jgi:two-component sensor histidine kinase
MVAFNPYPQPLAPGPDTEPDAALSGDHEADRLSELNSYKLLDTPPEHQFDSIVGLARVLFDTPMAAITLVDADRQWFKARSGIDDEQHAREHSFCNHAMRDNGTFVVADARTDPRFAENPLVRGAPNIRFYAGAPLRSPSGHDLGAVCVISPNPRDDFSVADRRKLEILASIVGNEMELRRRATNAHKMLYDQDLALREAHYRIKNSLDYASLLADVQSEDMTTPKLAAIAMAAWKQYSEAGGVLTSSIKSLRARMTTAEYNDLLDMMPGFGF